MATVAVDAMGGDTAPADPVLGTLAAARIKPDIQIRLVGDKKAIEDLCRGKHEIPGNVTIVHAAEAVGMEESPVEALRRKKDASIMRAARLVADGEADAVYSAGNTGATVVASTLSMGMLKGVKRPGIVVAVPTASGSCAVLDVGANIKCKPVHLLQYGYMGEVFAQTVLGVEKPRVGLLNIGEEDEKGNALVKETRHLMEKSDLNFVGNVEGREIFLGACDVAVMEGFVGNVLLKVVEGVIESVFTVLEAGMKRSNITELASNSFYRELKARMTYDEYGGALLLGTGGVCVIGHGRSNEKAIQNGVLTAARFVERGVIQSLADSIARSGTGG